MKFGFLIFMNLNTEVKVLRGNSVGVYWWKAVNGGGGGYTQGYSNILGRKVS